MNEKMIYSMFKDIISNIELQDSDPKSLPKEYDPSMTLESAGVSLLDFPDIVQEMRSRLGGQNLGLHSFLIPEEYGYFTFRNLAETIITSAGLPVKDPVVVYVDDEEENLFIFKRKYAKEFKLKTFTHPAEALDFIKTNNDVALVITDEMMPGISGNGLCDAVHLFKPNLKFILITGNPQGDGDLMYKTLRRNRFFEFINKPLDFEQKGQEYLESFMHVVQTFRR